MGTGGVLKARAGNDKPRKNFRTAELSGATKPHMEGAMQRFVPALKVVLIVCVVFLAAITVLGLVFGAEKPFATVYPMLMGLLAFGFLAGSRLATPKCPTCDTQQPAIRKPTSIRQLTLGGWTCANCGTEIDRHGKTITPTA